jgi:sugar phosphate permease
MVFSTLYTYTPKSFPTKSRGTGFGVASCLNRAGSLIAPILAANVGQGHAKPLILIGGVLVLIAAASMFLLPIEKRGRQGF